MAYNNIKFVNEDGIGILTISRPKALNALNTETVTELNDCVGKIEADESVKVVIITGEGAKSFVAGADIVEMSTKNPVEGRKFGKISQDTFTRIENLPQPVIAAVNGYALGGGCELACACDFRYAAENAKFGQPEVGLGIGTSVNRFGEYTMDGVGNSETNVPSLAKDKHIPDPYRDFGLFLNFQWEADIWGKLTRKKQAAVARWMASVEATRFAQSVLISELAVHYYELIGLDKRRDVLEEAHISSKRSYELTRQLKKEGAETQLAVDQFHARMLLIESKLLENDQLIGEKERAIACLLGVFPFEIRRMSFEELRQIPFPLSDGVPANMLTLRPDVRAAEMELLASKADVMAAKAAFYPSLVLGAGGGFNSFDLGKWFTAPASLVYDLAAGITAPVFQRNQIRSMWNEARASQRIALSQYHETALKAYTEVLDLYCAGLNQVERVRLKEVETVAHQRSVTNANELFKLNYVGFLEVLSANERYLDSELERIDIITDLCRKKILLYRALGGGC